MEHGKSVEGKLKTPECVFGCFFFFLDAIFPEWKCNGCKESQNSIRLHEKKKTVLPVCF